MSNRLDYICREAAEIVAALDAIGVVMYSSDVARYHDLAERAGELVRFIEEVGP